MRGRERERERERKRERELKGEIKSGYRVLSIAKNRHPAVANPATACEEKAKGSRRWDQSDTTLSTVEMSSKKR